ncbi:AzlD domain-containing protein [Frankia gtarii]|uniref:AzlD domain-containing protein n=1 Tax=Frankia gtarii TaxID=2950102 RepID=UPI0021BDF25F|nr:AzlD domain-containing protein [Frankia gtarii]
MWSAEAVLAVVGMALITYSLRVGGLLAADWLPSGGPWARAIGALPGAVLVAVVAPAVIAQGWAGVLAGVATAGVAYRTRNLLASMAVGVALIVLGRRLGLA